jgi:hypothetical protein
MPSVNITIITRTASKSRKVWHLPGGLTNNIGGGSYAPAAAFTNKSAFIRKIRR